MNEHQKFCHELLIKWCAHKATDERKLIGRCRNAYKEPLLSSLTAKYADALEEAAKLFDNLREELEESLEQERVKDLTARASLTLSKLHSG